MKTNTSVNRDAAKEAGNEPTEIQDQQMELAPFLIIHRETQP